MMNSQAIAFAQQALAQGKSVALAILSESGRDTPGVAGSMLAVREDGRKTGTIGGGKVEALVVQECQKALNNPSFNGMPFDFSLKKGNGMDMLCGGEMKGVITVVRPQRKLIIFGGGHVGHKLYEAGLVAGFDVTVVEDRPKYATAFEQARFVHTDNLAKTTTQLLETGENYVVIVTRGHSHDYAVLAAAAQCKTAYLGMIGSRGKVKILLEQLRKEGVAEETIQNIYSPIGVDIDDGTPGEIAIGIMAELLAVKNQAVLRHCRDVNKPTQ